MLLRSPITLNMLLNHNLRFCKYDRTKNTVQSCILFPVLLFIFICDGVIQVSTILVVLLSL